jgi:hypothetical protein
MSALLAGAYTATVRDGKYCREKGCGHAPPPPPVTPVTSQG